MSKVTSVYNLSQQTSRDLAAGSWPEFLRTAAWNYRYSFPNQVLIYAQKPDATACASMDDWNKKLHRLVNPNAAGIALLEDSGDTMQLSYIFDVSDTHSPSGSSIPLWTMTPEKEEEVRLALANTFLPGSHPYRDDVNLPDPTNFYYEVAHYICDQMAEPSVQDLLSLKDSFPTLKQLSDEALELEFRTLLESSVVSVFMYRCGLEPDIDPHAWESARRFQDLPAMAILGQTTQNLARQGLEVARSAVRKWDKEHKEEKKHDQEHSVPADRRIPDPGIEYPASEASEPLREDAQAVPAGAQTQSVYRNDADRGADGASAQHRGADPDAGSPANGISVGTESGTGEGGQQPELDEAHEPDAESGRRDGLSGDNLRLTDEEGNPLPDAVSEGLDVEFSSTEQQEAIVLASSSALNLTQDEIDSVLNQIIESMGADEKLIAVFQDEPNSSQAVSALREAYESLDDVFRLSFNDDIAAVAGRPYGIEVKQGDSCIIPWEDFAVYFQKQVENNRFAPEPAIMPTSSAELKEGQIFSLSGTQYKVIAISAAVVGLQDVNYPIFTNTIPRNTLDLLLRNNAPAVPVPAHNPEPLIDHPELRHRDLSRDARSDKVVLADLLMHFADYAVSYEMHMPVLPDHDLAAYQEQCASLENMVVSSVAEENRPKIQEAVAFFNRWFVPFSDAVGEQKQNTMYQVLNAAEDVLNNWDDIDFLDSQDPQQEASEPEIAVDDSSAFTVESFHVGDFYEDAFGRGVITHISPEEYDGNHKAVFSYVDPDAPAGSRDAKGYVMDMAGAIDRLNKGEASLLSAAQWQAQRGNNPDLPSPQPEEPTLFDFAFEEPAVVQKEENHPPVSVNAVPDSEPSERINFRIGVEEENYGGPKARFQGNIAAIRLLKELEAQDRLATPEEQKILSRYVGWGGLPDAFDETKQQWQEEYTTLKELLTEEEYRAARESTLTAFYTPPAVTEAIYAGLKQLGFQGGNILDPSCGTGNFFGMLPEELESSRLYGVELDPISGRIGRQLYQNANILIEGYEKTSLPDSMFDVAVGNVPFGNFQLRDRRYDKEHFLIHDYFFAKTLDKVRPGGIIAFVTSKGTLDKENDAARRYIAHRADLLGAIRLPDNTFKNNAGTEVVSDILFLRKRERPSIEEPYWVGLDSKYLGYNEETGEALFGPQINAYFVENPEMVLGDLEEVSGPHGPVLTCKAREGEDLRTQLLKAVQNLEGSIGMATPAMDALDNPSEQKNSIPADPNVRNFSYTVVDGDIYFREDSLMFRCDMNKTAEKRVKGMVNLRNITRDLIQAQLDNAPDAHIDALQAQLNAAYDAFTQKHDIINSTANSRAFSDDSSYYLLCSLENLDDEGNFVSKADIFTKRTIGQHKAPDHVETAQDALAVSLGERARVDLRYMSRLSDLSEEKLISELEGLIFPVPGGEGEYQISSLYLSGNVREKLREAQEAAKEDPRFEKNVSYLEQALPEPLEASDISVRLGSTWIPEEDYRDFLFELLNLPEWCERYIDVNFEPITGYWNISNKHLAPYNTLRSSTYGTGRADALDIIEKTLNLRDVQVYDTKEDADGKTKRVLNAEETLAAQEKQQQIKDAFSEWIWKDHDRRERLCSLYNEKFNCIVPPTFSEDLVRFHGMNPLIELAPHQKESVARILFNGNTLLAHCVGAGKTWTMTASAMEGKYLGLCNKSLIVVPNHLIGQWAAAIYEAYPQANVLASTEKDFEPANRKKFCSRIATGDYDIVVIGHSHFEKIPLSPQRQEATIQKEMDDIIDSISQLKASQGEAFSIKKLEAAKKSLQTKLDKLHNSKKRDDVITFEELGVDRLYVDESHNYKNLFISTKMHNVAGISQTDSQKASDMFVKSRYMDEITGGMGIIHATGTALSNTMAELFTTQRYLQYDLLQKLGLGSFDAWGSTFGETVVALELAPEGNGYRPRTRFAKFFNLPELMNLYKQVADIRTKDMLNLPVPAVEYQVEVLKPSEEQKAIVKSFGERADKIRKGGVNNREDNMLCITNEGRKVALDQRLIDPSLPDNPNSKTNACANSVYDFYKNGDAEKLTQLVFCDLSTPKSGVFNVYDDLKEKLVAKGIPADEIRYIHEANTTAQKEALFAKVRSGAVRVLMGSTSKMGTGTCVQDRLIAGHDLDAPWRPSDLEQRSGRVIRRGNLNDKVFMRRYVTEGTFDAYMYQLLEIKQRFIDQVFSSKNPARVIDDVDGAALDYAEIKALSSGDPRIKEKVALEMEIAKLEVMKNRHFNDMYRLESKLKKLPGEIKALTETVAAMKKDFEKVCSRPSRTEEGRLIPASVKGVTYEKQEDAGNALKEAAKKLSQKGEWTTIGSLRGFEIQGVASKSDERGNISVRMAIAGNCRYGIDVPDSGQGLMTRLNNILDKTIETRLDSSRKKLAACESDLITIKSQLNKLFPDEELLQQKKAQLAKLDEELNLEAQENKESFSGRGEVEVEVVEPSGKRSLSEIIASAAERAGTAGIPGQDPNHNLGFSRS